MHQQAIYKRITSNLLPIDIVTIGYLLITLLFILFSSSKLNSEWSHIFLRVIIIGLIFWLLIISQSIKNQTWQFFRNFYPLLLFGLFYSETDYLNNVLFENLDPLAERVELWIFGVHPSIIFSHYFPQVWFSELMNFGYFSYYFFIFLLPFWLWIKKQDSFLYVIFAITASFYLYYCFFICFPVAGPQFYLEVSLRSIPNSGIFRGLVRFAEWLGEGPTAAFPSSHVGAMVIMAVLAYKYAKKLFWIYVLFGILICFSTVYIKAHYAIDVIGGIITAPLFLWISKWLYKRIN